jgi:PadR family transcriptional regulator, regulatory protein PadR
LETRAAGSGARGFCFMAKTADLLPGTLDLLILKAVSLGPLHGYGILLRIQQMSRDVLQIEQGSLYPALYRLERQRLIEAEWGTSENNRQAKFYSLTAAGTRHLQTEMQQWRRFANAMSNVLEALPDEV